MENKEKEILEKLSSQTKDAEIPEHLRPEQMEQKLNGKMKKEKKHRAWKAAYTYGLAAACFACVIGVTAYMTNSGNSPVQTSVQKETKKEMKTEEGDRQIRAAKDYEEIYACIPEDGVAQYARDGKMLEEADTMAGSAKEQQASPADGGGGGTYSQTNVRQEGVDEGDIAKTDGTYLYVMKENAGQISIVETKDMKMEQAGLLELSQDLDQGEKTDYVIREFYVSDEKLIVLYNYSEEKADNYKNFTGAATYDVSDAPNPKLLGSVSQSGSYSTSRLVDGYLYLFSDFYVNYGGTLKDYDGYVPAVNGKRIAPANIYMPYENIGSSYTVISSVAVEKPDKVVDGRAIFSNAGLCYVSNENIYMSDVIYGQGSNGSQTEIRKIAYKNGELIPKVRGTVSGSIKDSFCLDEYEGNLRVVTTTDQTSNAVMPFTDGTGVVEPSTENALYVLDEELEVIGEITKLAKGEQVKSAWFMGETGYFVTFEQIDPLFSVELSDPKNPKIVGKLKIPGFSEYLHFYGEDLLFGIGQDIDANGVTSGGVKLSMFDISDPSDVKEVNKHVIKGAYSSSVFYNYKAALIAKEKDAIGFPVHGGNSGNESYYVFGYQKGKGFVEKLQKELSGNMSEARGIYIEDAMYIIKGNVLELFDMKTYKKADDLVL